MFSFLRVVFYILGFLLIFLGSASGIASLIYFAAELFNGVSFFIAAWSGIKVLLLGILSIIIGVVFVSFLK